MARRGVATLLLTWLAACSHGTPLAIRPFPAARSLVVRNVRVFDAPHAALLAGTRDVVVRDGRITAVDAPGTAAPGLPELDGQGGTLLPGLIDVHTHTGASAEPLGRFALPDLAGNLAAFLYAGVTTALDLGSLSPDVFRTRAAVADGTLLGPHLYAAGPIFTAPGGHPADVLRANLPWFLGWYVVPRATREVADPAASTEAVRALMAEHPDVLKIAVDAGVGDVPRLTPEAFAALTAAAHAAGVRAITHVTSAADARLAIEHGSDALAHMPAIDEVPDDLADAIARAHVPVVATLAIWDLIESNTRRAADFLPIEREVAGPALLAHLEAAGPAPMAFQRALAAAHETRRRSFARLRRAGVTILAGSDACNPGDLPGAGLHVELRKLVEAGMTPGEALRSATVENARFLAGTDADFGEIAVGKRADLVLVAGDPVADIADVDRIAAVVLEGALLTRNPPP